MQLCLCECVCVVLFEINSIKSEYTKCHFWSRPRVKSQRGLTCRLGGAQIVSGGLTHASEGKKNSALSLDSCFEGAERADTPTRRVPRCRSRHTHVLIQKCAHPSPLCSFFWSIRKAYSASSANFPDLHLFSYALTDTAVLSRWSLPKTHCGVVNNCLKGCNWYAWFPQQSTSFVHTLTALTAAV